MKNINLYLILLLLLGSFGVYSQVTGSSAEQNSDWNIALDDPKLSPEEKAQLLKAGEDNPARIAEALQIDAKVDPKSLPTEEDYGEANAKAVEVEPDPKHSEEEPGIEAPSVTEPVVRTTGGNNQPPGEQAGILHDYRNMPSEGGTQPPGETPANNPNYREIQGSGTQPPGDNPDK